MPSPPAYLIDSSIYIFRAWFSLPDRWHSAAGMPLNAVYGYTRFLLEFLEAQRPQHCVAAFDESLGSCFRNEIYPQYKASRELPDEALAFQLRACREVTERLGLPCYGGERYEADDYLATLAALYRREGIAVCVVTRDKDLGQLLSDSEDRWWDYAAGVMLDRDDFQDRFGVRPEQFGDYLALVGDPVDDIPGVPGVGARTAAALLQAFDNLGELRDDLGRVAGLRLRGAAGLVERLQTHWPQVEMSRELASLESRVPGLEAIPRFELSGSRLDDLASYLGQLGLEGPLTRRCESLARALAA
jgi:5'-3' exonuclease